MNTQNKITWNDIFSKYLNSKEGPIQIAIVGAGIFGCHLANELSKGKSKITLYEKEDTLFSGASAWGDTRIHNGVKYLRNKKTRDLLISEQLRFIKKYPHFLTSEAEHEEEIQMISEDYKTILDFGSFVDLYDKSVNGRLIKYSDHQNNISISKNSWSKIMTKEEIEKNFSFKNIEGGILHGVDICPKIYVDFPKKWFYSEFLKKNNISLKLNKTVSLKKSNKKNIITLDIIEKKPRLNFKIGNNFFDYIINCTYNQSFPLINKKEEPPFYEVGFSLIFSEKEIKSKKKFRPFSVYDGPFPGMTPFNIKNFDKSLFSEFKNKKLYTATSARLGESFQTYDIEYAYKIKNKRNQQAYERFIKKYFYSLEDKEEDVKNILNSILHYYPNLMNDFEVIYKYWWIKSLYPSASASRPIIVESNQNIHPKFLNIFSNKLSTVIKAEELLLEKIIHLESNV